LAIKFYKQYNCITCLNCSKIVY